MKDYSNYHKSHKEKVLVSLNKTFELSLKGFDGKDALIDGQQNRVLIQTHSNPMNEDKEDRKISCWNSTLVKRGSIIEFDSSKWIVVSKPTSNQVYKIAKIYECNNEFKWQDENLTTHSYPVLILDKTSVYSDGLNVSKFITLTDDQILITIPNNPQTKKLKIGKRIVFNNDIDNLYKITKIQDLVHDGLIYITMSRHEYNSATDNVELGICDYVEVTHDIQILNAGYVELNYMGGTVQLNTIAKRNDVVDTNPIITYTSSNEYVAVVDANGLVTCNGTGTTLISAHYNGVTDTIEIKGIMLETPDNLVVNIVGDNSIYIGQSKNYTCEFMNNDSIAQFSSHFWITADDGIFPTDLATITTQNSELNSCSIKANTNNKYGYIRLYTRNLQETVLNYKRIHIRSLL